MQPSIPDPASLDRLRDIVLPPDPSWWPPAPGWIVLALLLAAGLVTALLLLRRRHRKNAYRRVALAELDRIAASDAVSEVPSLLRRTALVAYSREVVVDLTGDVWLAFLDRTGGTRDFTEGAGRTLNQIAYDPTAEVAGDALLEIARAWIRNHRSTGETRA